LEQRYCIWENERGTVMDIQESLRRIEKTIEQGPYRADWESLSRHGCPAWYSQGKLGIFVHWGIYSVPAFGNEWYSRNMYNPVREEYVYHQNHFGTQDKFGYKDFIPEFTGMKFDPDAWADLFQESGARYVMPVAEHHDGFAMYRTELNRWNAADMGPKTDVIGRVKYAVEARGLKFCASTHRAEHYFFMNLGRTCDSDVNDPAYGDFYGPAVYSEGYNGENLGVTAETPASPGPTEKWMEDWMVRTCEFIDNYQPKVLYFDWWIQNYAFKPYLKKIAAYYYNRAVQWGEEVTINYKREAFPPGVATFDVERGALPGISPVPWQTCTAIGRDSWGYTKNNRFKSSRQIICDLIDIVSKNGILLLNVGPRADGTITEEETKVLEDLGSWLKENGEGIYDTTPWKTFGEGDVNARSGYFTDEDEQEYTASDFRFTYRGGCVYGFQMRPEGKIVKIRSMASHGMYDFGIEAVDLIGKENAVVWQRSEEGLEIRLEGEPDSRFPRCFRIRLK